MLPQGGHQHYQLTLWSSEVDRPLRQSQLGGKGPVNDYVSGLESAGTAAPM